jgi:hypothetical protein
MIADIYAAHPIITGATICATMFIAALAAWTFGHPHHQDAKHRPSRAHR